MRSGLGLRLSTTLSAWIRARDRSDLLAALLLVTLAAIALATYGQYAISNDEEVQHRYGELIIAYYASGFVDHGLFTFRNLYLYGGLFDVIAVAASHVLPLEPYHLRHILSAAIGIGGIGGTWATARLVAGPRAGLLAAALLAACGPWYGAMFNHTKDIPFAAAMIGATWFLVRLSRDLPRPQLRHVVGFGVLLGAALGLRVIGLILIGFAGLAVLMAMPGPLRTQWRAAIGFCLRSGLALMPALVIGYLIMIAAWPWAAQAPLNPIRALFAFADFHYQIRTLFSGAVYEMANVPRWYVPAYLAIKLPLPILLGAVLTLPLMLRPTSIDHRRREVALVAMTAAIPLACHVLGNGPAFSGLRHFLFVVPPLAVLAGIGIDAVLGALAARQRAAATAIAALLFARLAWNAMVLVQLHPHQYLFYNALVGGLEGASRAYETDYWVNIMPEAVDELEAFIDRNDRALAGKPARRYTVAVCGERLSFEKEADPRLKWVQDWKQADFFIAPTHMDCDRALDGQVIATIQRLGVPIGVVKDRRSLRRAQPELARGP